jgi:hypothetical protein
VRKVRANPAAATEEEKKKAKNIELTPADRQKGGKPTFHRLYVRRREVPSLNLPPILG